MESKAVVSLQFLPVSSCRWKADEPAVVMHTAGGRRKRLGVGGRAREAQRFWELWKKKTRWRWPIGGFKKFLFYFFIWAGNDPIWLAHIFQMGWFNHQLVEYWPRGAVQNPRILKMTG